MKHDATYYKNLSDKHLGQFLLANQWIQIRQSGRSLSQYLLDRGYKRVIIYGVGYLGETLYRELKNSDINVICGVDSKTTDRLGLSIIEPDQEWPRADVVIVTAISAYEQINAKFGKKVECPLVSLEEIIGYMILRNN